MLYDDGLKHRLLLTLRSVINDFLNLPKKMSLVLRHAR